MSLHWHAKREDEVLRALNTTVKGLSSDEARRRLEEYGPNELIEAKRTSALEIFLNQFKDVFVIMLIVATAIAYYVDFVKSETPIDAITIAAIVVLNAIVGFVQEYRSEKAMEAMKKRGCEEAFLEVRVSNHPAISLYRKLGFKEVKRIPFYYRDGEEALVMAKPL